MYIFLAGDVQVKPRQPFAFVSIACGTKRLIDDRIHKCSHWIDEWRLTTSTSYRLRTITIGHRTNTSIARGSEADDLIVLFLDNGVVSGCFRCDRLQKLMMLIIRRMTWMKLRYTIDLSIHGNLRKRETRIFTCIWYDSRSDIEKYSRILQTTPCRTHDAYLSTTRMSRYKTAF